MKNSQKGFVVPLVIAVIALLVIGGGVYFYKMNSGTKLPVSSGQNDQNVPVNVQPETQMNVTSPVATPVSPVIKNTVPVVENQLKTYTQKAGVYSFKYQAGSVNPNTFVYIDSTNGVIIPIPVGQSPDSIQDIKDPKPINQGATLLTLNDSAGNMIAELTFVMAANEKFTSLIQNAGSKPVSLGSVDGFPLIEYAPLTQQSQGVAVYKLSLGSYKSANGGNIDESLLILAEHVSSSPSLDKNFQAIEQVLQTIVPNASVISKIILNS